MTNPDINIGATDLESALSPHRVGFLARFSGALRGGWETFKQIDQERRVGLMSLGRDVLKVTGLPDGSSEAPQKQVAREEI